MHSQRGGAQGFPPPAFYCSYHAALSGLCQPAQNPCFQAKISTNSTPVNKLARQLNGSTYRINGRTAPMTVS